MLDTNNQIDYKAILYSQLFGLFVSLIILCLYLFVPPFIFRIHPDTTYGWFGGIWQGMFSIGNYIISLFRDNWFVMAPSHTKAYTVFFWINCIGTIASFARVYIKIVSEILTTRRASRS